MLAAVAGGTLAGCPTGGLPTSPDPVRFVLEGGPAACRIVLGPLTPDAAHQIEDVGEVTTPDGPTYLLRGIVAGDRGAPDLEIDRIDVHLSTTGGRVQVTWLLPPTSIGIDTRSLDEDEVREALPTFVSSSDISALARLVAERVDGAEVSYAGRAPEYDVGLVHEDGSALLVAGRGVTDRQLDAYVGALGGVLAGDRAEDATVIAGSARARAEVTSTELTAVLEQLLGGGPPAIAISDGRMVSTGGGCEPPPTTTPVDATIREVSIAESDIGDLLRITFDGLPPDGPDPQLLHVAVGGVELVAPFEGEETVLFPATLTHEESRLLQARLGP
jgi:hypothetical protein